MFYSTELITPLGTVTLASDGDALCGLWFHGQKYFAASISGAMHQKDGLEIFRETKTGWNVILQGNGRRSENCRCVRLIGIQTERLEDFM